MDHKTGTYEFKQGDRVEVVAGMFEGVKDKVIFVDYVDRNVELHAGVCIGFARVLNLIKGRADDVTGSMK